MERGWAQLLKAVKNYPQLAPYNKIALKTWLSSIGNFLLTVFKFVMGCVTGSGFLYVSALYSFLIGFAKRQYSITALKQEGEKYSSRNQFRRMGTYVLLAGAVYGVYLGRLIIYHNKETHYDLLVVILVALVSFIDIGIAVCTLFKKNMDGLDEILMLGRKFVGLASSLPAIVMTQIVINSFANGDDTSLSDGILGVTIGFVIFAIGVGMIWYSVTAVEENGME